MQAPHAAEQVEDVNYLLQKVRIILVNIKNLNGLKLAYFLYVNSCIVNLF